MEVNTSPFFVVISGGSASGKTLLVNKLMETHHENELSVISMDNYYLSINEQREDENGYVNFDLPQALDINAFINDVKQLSLGNSIERQQYNFNYEGIKPKKIEVKPAKIVILEGIFVLSIEALAKYLNYKVFLHVDETTMLKRKIHRDATERGMDMEWIMYQWERHTKPGYKTYLEPYKDKVDLTIDNTGSIDSSVERLKTEFRRLLNNR